MGIITISLSNIQRNYLNLCKQIGKSCLCSAVIKADAYGLGIKYVMPALYQVGCRHFFVATIDEGIIANEVRSNLNQEGFSCNIYCLHGVSSELDVRKCVDNNIIPILNNRFQCDLWCSIVSGLAVGVQCNLGMNRLGFEISELSYVMEKVNCILYMGHLSCVDKRDAPENIEQLRKFQDSLRFVPSTIPKSLANSGAIFFGKEYHFDMVRPGCALYCSSPTSWINKSGLLSVVQVRANVLQVRRIAEAGAFVGYDAYYKAEVGSKLATIEWGYADGYPQIYCNGNDDGLVVMYNGYRLPVVGRISMDISVINVTHVPDEILDRMRYVDIMNNEITLDVIAEIISMNKRNFLINLSKRFSRIYE